MDKISFWNRRSTKIIWGISAFIAALILIRILLPNREYCYEVNTSFQEGVPLEAYPVYEGIRLPPGVYRVELTYSCSTDMQNLCTMKDDSVFTKGLLTHGDFFYSGLSRAGFHMWLFENADAMRLQIKYCGQGELRIDKLYIYETDQLWTISLTIHLFITALLLAAGYFRLYVRTFPLSGEVKNVVFALSVLALLASAPYMTGSVASGADLSYHLHRIEGIKDGILSGQFPVRLEPEWVHGYGYANGIFYCGTLLLFPALLRIIGFPVIFSYSCYCVALNIFTILISYYSFYGIFRSRYIGAAGSALYTMSVFRIYKFLITSAVGEASALAFMPLIVYGFWRVFTGEGYGRSCRGSWFPLAFGYAGLIQTHVLSCEITVFLTAILCVVYVKKIFSKERFWELCKGALGGLGLSCWFLVPFVDYFLREDMHVKHVWARPIQDRGLYLAQLLFNWWRFGDNALIGESGMVRSHALGVGFVLGLGFFLFGVLWFGGRLSETGARIWKLGKTAWALGGMLMLMSLEFFPWDRIQNSSRLAASLVSSLQFPNRFLGWGSLFLVLLCCCCLYCFWEKKRKRLFFTALVWVLAGLVTSGLYLYDHVGRDQKHLALYNREGMGAGYISGAEYLIQGTREETLLYRDPVVSGGVRVSEYEKGALRAEFVCDNAGREEGYVDLPLLHYYGYRAYAGDGEERLQVCKGDNNVVRVIIPPQSHMKVAVMFVSPWYWRAAEWVSAAAAVWIGICLLRRVKRKGERL